MRNLELDEAGVLREFLPAAVVPFAAVQPSLLPFQPARRTEDGHKTSKPLSVHKTQEMKAH